MTQKNHREGEEKDDLISTNKVIKAYKKEIKKIEETKKGQMIYEKLIISSTEVVQRFINNSDIDLEPNFQDEEGIKSDLSEYIGLHSQFIRKGYPNFSKVLKNPRNMDINLLYTI